MKYLIEFLETEDLKAETLLPFWNLNEDFQVQMDGVFARNFAEDLTSVEKGDGTSIVTLSRDGIAHLFPEGLFYPENKLRNGNRRGFDFKKEYADLKKKKKEILSFFQPFDTEFFKLSLAFEQKLNVFTENGNAIFNACLKDAAETESSNIYISKMKVLLPFASQIRGNIPLLIDLLRNVLPVEKIEIEKIGLFHLRFIIHKEGLNEEEYSTMDKDLELFFDFFRHWFLPIEQKYDYRIKDCTHPFTLGTKLILDYNTHL